MNVVALLGSRDPEGRTARAAGALLDGVTDSGGRVERVCLPELTLERCRQCEADGWGLCRQEGRCIVEDDFAPVVEKIRAADAAVFATPVYFSDLSESARGFLDRLRRTCRHDAGKAGVAGKPAVGLCVAGGGGGGAPACAASLDRVLNTCGFEVVDVIPARRQNLANKLNVLRMTGRWLAGWTPEK